MGTSLPPRLVQYEDEVLVFQGKFRLCTQLVAMKQGELGVVL
jgi:hypothetical protein